MTVEELREANAQALEQFESSVTRYIAWRKVQVDRIDQLEVAVKLHVQRDHLLVGVIESLVDLVDASVQPGSFVQAERFEHLGESVDDFEASAGEALRVSAGEQLAQVRERLADLRSLVDPTGTVKDVVT